MIERYNVWEEGEYTYPGAFGFAPNFRTYLHEDDKIRPAVLVVPGGGYRMVSPTEGEIVAMKFYEMGYQTFVFTYTTNQISFAPLKDQPMKDLSRAIRLIRKKAEEFRLEPEHLFICGFSAGSHLCGSIAVHWQDIEDTNPGFQKISNKPTGVILSYPVITSGEFAHRDSFTALLGENATEEELNYHSLEKQVTKDTPPIFLWQTVTDEVVPVENSYLMAEALKAAGVSFEHHVFPTGRHGLSLSNEDWANGRFGEPYTMEQTMRALDAVRTDAFPMTAEEKKEKMACFAYMEQGSEDGENHPVERPVKAVEIWPELAQEWMKSCM